jgi:hypothetical protein
MSIGQGVLGSKSPALANMVIPREQQCYPRSALPASKFEQGEES